MNNLGDRALSVENPVLRLTDTDNEGLKTQLLQEEDVDIPVTPEPGGVKLDSVDDPITGRPVAPPPYVLVLHSIDAILSGWESKGLPDQDKNIIRLFLWFFLSF
jgi:hypothetical protein